MEFKLSSGIVKNSQDRGTALIIAIVTVLFLSGLVLGFVWWISSESKRATIERATTTSIYIGEAATERAYHLLKSSPIYAQQFIQDPPATATFYWLLNGSSVTVIIDGESD